MSPESRVSISSHTLSIVCFHTPHLLSSASTDKMVPKTNPYGFAAFNRSLHHVAQCLSKLLDLIDAAAETFDIALV